MEMTSSLINKILAQVCSCGTELRKTYLPVEEYFSPILVLDKNMGRIANISWKVSRSCNKKTV